MAVVDRVASTDLRPGQNFVPLVGGVVVIAAGDQVEDFDFMVVNSVEDIGYKLIWEIAATVGAAYVLLVLGNIHWIGYSCVMLVCIQHDNAVGEDVDRVRIRKNTLRVIVGQAEGFNYPGYNLSFSWHAELGKTMLHCVINAHVSIVVK